MKTIKFLSFIVGIGLMASCSKSSSPSAVSPSSAQQTFSTVNTDVSAAISGLSSAPGNVALNSFASLNSTSSPFGRFHSFSDLRKPSDVKAAMGAGAAAIRSMLVKTTSNGRVAGSSFNFNDKIGTYTWSKENHKWNYTSGGGIIKIDYPSDTSSATNDTELQITAYTEVQVGSDYYPTDIEAAIYQPIGGAKQLGLTFKASGYDDTGSPNKVSVSLYINPYTISFSVDDSQSASTTESFSFSQGSTTYIGTSATATYASAADKTNGNSPASATGYLQLENTRFDIAIDYTKAATATSQNDYITITVTINGGLAGHVVWVADQNGDEQPYVQYNDKFMNHCQLFLAIYKVN
ncbi:MAG: hypothetical protein QM734_08955 [Cyclobacteriaceae bacterium]